MIFASLGTVFNYIVLTYKKILESFKTFDHGPEESRHPSFRLINLTIVVSLGADVLNEINEIIKNGTYEVPENII